MLFENLKPAFALRQAQGYGEAKPAFALRQAQGYGEAKEVKMDFELSEEHKMIQSLMRNFAEKEAKPKVKEFEERGEFPRELVQKLGKVGLMGIFVPGEYDGMNADILAYTICEEELARVWPSLGLIMSANNSLSIYPILKFGSESQRQKYLPSLAKGEKLGCFALTEPEAGSDVSSIKTSAKKEENIWKVSGTKTLITNASEAQVCILVARTSKEPYKGLTAFIAEIPSAGFTVSKIEKKMGLHSSPTCEIVFEDYQVLEENLLGELGGGFKVAMETLNAGRINIAAQAVGIAQGAYELALEYSKTRKQFGQPIFEFQAIQFMLADMARTIEAARSLTYKAAWLKDKGVDVRKEASMAKTSASETAVEVTIKAIQIFGGYGYLRDFNVERYHRDAIATILYEGTNQIQRKTIASSL